MDCEILEDAFCSFNWADASNTVWLPALHWYRINTRNPPSIHLNCVGLHWIVEDFFRWLQSGIALNCPWIVWIVWGLQLIWDSQSTVQSRKSARNSQNAVAIENRKINDCMGIARFREDHLSTIFPLIASQSPLPSQKKRPRFSPQILTKF